MSLNRATRAANIVSRIAAIGVQAGTPVTGPQLLQVWTIVLDEDFLELESNAKVNAGAFQVVIAGGSSAGTYPVTGQGGPLE